MKFLFQTFDKQRRFEDLKETVKHCNLCSRLFGRRKVLSDVNGSINSKVLFVAEAPGRLGAERTGIPLFGDKTGDNFEKLLGNISWSRDQIFITNSILCNPQQEDGNNDTPLPEEILNCSAYLEMAIALIQPDVVVTLGAMALKALDTILPHGIELKKCVGELKPWLNTRVFPLYHPGPRAAVHRSLEKQRSDFMRLAKVVHPINGLIEHKKQSKKLCHFMSNKVTILQQVVKAIVELSGHLSYFKLTKLLYLVDLLALKRYGNTIASDIYLRQVDGPWPPKLDQELSMMDGYEVRRWFIRTMPMVAMGPFPRFEVELDDRILELVVEVYNKYNNSNNSEIKSAVYLTEPMRFIATEERKGKDMRNTPVLYKDKMIFNILNE